MIKKAMSVFISIILFALLPSSAFACYKKMRTPDTTKTLLYYVHQDFGGETMSHMNDALYLWNQATGYTLMKRDPMYRYNKTDYGTTSAKDGVSNVYRKNVGIGKYVAQNTTYSQVHGNSVFIVESDININVAHKYANSAQPACYDTWSIFLHETGHTVGLQNCDIKSHDAVMYETARMNTISYRYLKSADLNKLKEIY